MNITKIKMEDSKKKRWHKEESKDGVTKRVEVEQVENGYIISKTKEHQDSEKGFQYICKKYISKENPFDDIDTEFLKGAYNEAGNDY